MCDFDTPDYQPPEEEEEQALFIPGADRDDEADLESARSGISSLRIDLNTPKNSSTGLKI